MPLVTADRRPRAPLTTATGWWSSARSAGIVLIAAVVVAGCVSTPPSTPSTLPATPTPISLSPAPATATEALGDDDNHGQMRSTAPEPTADKDRAEAVLAAEKVMVLFARTGVGADRWMKDLEPYLSAQAQQDYQGTDPANVPARKVTGRATVVATDSARLARVHVPTNAGVYLVVLSRSPSDPTWRVERITPPEEPEEVGD